MFKIPNFSAAADYRPEGGTSNGVSPAVEQMEGPIRLTGIWNRQKAQSL
jgi:hypothetical protein